MKTAILYNEVVNLAIEGVIQRAESAPGGDEAEDGAEAVEVGQSGEEGEEVLQLALITLSWLMSDLIDEDGLNRLRLIRASSTVDRVYK